MLVLETRNVHSVFPSALWLLLHEGVKQESRNGPVLTLMQPVTTVYRNPRERVMFWSERDANPFFHFFESLWMLNGQNDVMFPARFAKQIKKYSDDGKIFHGAYGYRWRNHFKQDQLLEVIANLRNDHTDRRQVVQMWDASVDLPDQSSKKDLPCNLMVTFQIVMDSLDMVVFNRSNDIVWGSYGSNVVHFSMLHEFMASAIGVPTGTYSQISVNWHGYLDTLLPLTELSKQSPLETPDMAIVTWDPYALGQVRTFPLMGTPHELWLEDLSVFMMEEDTILYRDSFFNQVASPMIRIHKMWKSGERQEAFDKVDEIKATDWRMACRDWMARRMTAQDDGVRYE